MNFMYSRANESAFAASPTALRDARFGLGEDAAFLLRPCTMYPLSSSSSAKYDLHNDCQQVELASPGAMHTLGATGQERTRLDPIRLLLPPSFLQRRAQSSPSVYFLLAGDKLQENRRAPLVVCSHCLQ